MASGAQTVGALLSVLVLAGLAWLLTKLVYRGDARRQGRLYCRFCGSKLKLDKATGSGRATVCAKCGRDQAADGP